MSDAIGLGSHTSARSRIVDAATMLFWREGYHAVSTDAICRAADVKKGSLYYAFPAKADVLAACLDQVWTTNWSEIQAIYAQPGAPTAKLRAHLRWFADSQQRLKDRFGLVLGTFDMALGVSIPEPIMIAMREHQSQHFTRVKTSLMEVLQLGAADEKHATWLSEVVLQLINGTMSRARLNNDIAPLRKLTDTIFRLIRSIPPA